MRKVIVFAALSVFCSAAFPASMNFTGNFRSETAYFNKPDLGSGVASGMSKSYLSARALLNPSLIIDDHFTLHSQWSLLTSPNITAGGSNLGIGQGSYIFGDSGTMGLFLSRAWLEWTSDFGVMRLGRMPISWGYGLLWDSGNQIWDDFQSTADRLEYRLNLGHVTGALAFTKGLKGSVFGESNDSAYYTVFLRYDNPELDVEGGILYENQWRSPSQVATLTGSASGHSNPYALPPGNTSYPLAVKSPYPRTNHVIDLYLRKTAGYFTFGGELAWLTGKATDFNGNGSDDSLNAIGAMLNVTYELHSVKAFLDFLYASGDNNLNDDSMNGFVLLNRNRRPGLILGRELLGTYTGNNVGLGSCVVYGNNGSFSGCYFVRPGVKVTWSPAWSSGIELIFAQKASVQAGENGNLGVELDLGTQHAVYQNFDLGVNVAYLFAGKGLQVANPQGVLGLRATAALRF